ncbi:MAG: glycine cleavage T C-terminal barrel domain-containing protein [bacterium]|nr:glycine cleavage T C-terminal barrel domain-containing protein [bacterium]
MTTKSGKATKPFDMSLVQRGARLRRTPFFEATQRWGAKAYTVYNHTLFPICYDDPEREYAHLLKHVTLWDVSVERQVEITGPDAFEFTNMLTPRDLSKCAVGQGKYVVITAEDGGIINDPVLLRLGEKHFWLALADSDVLLWARGVALHSGLRVNITEPDVSPLQIQGPKAKEVVQALFGDAATKLRYYWFIETNLDGIPVVVTRTGWTGEVGYEVYLRDGSRGDELWERIMEAGKPYKIRPTGPSDIRRIEAGILNWGADMTLENNPYEVGLEYLVSEDKTAPYIGRDALRRIKADGVRRKLVGVEIEGERLEMNAAKWPVEVLEMVSDDIADYADYADYVEAGVEAGRVTSAIWSPRLKKNIGYAMVPIEYALPGTVLRVKIPSVIEYTLPGTTLRVKVPSVGERCATVVPKPFIDPKKEIPKT